MKKNLFLGMVLVAAVGCSQNEELENAGQNAEIKFGTVVSTTTRAAITDDAALQKTGFNVYAYNTEKEIEDAATTSLGSLYISGSANYTAAWELDKTYYWPLTGKTHFFAYAKDENATYEIAAGDKYPTISYTILDDVSKQKDFVVSKLANQDKSTNPIPLVFTHALTQVNFSALKTDDLDYRIKSITISGLAKTGKYSFETEDWLAGSETTGSYTYPLGSVTIEKTATDLMATNGSLILMPQAMTASSKITVVYEIYSANVQIGGQTTEIGLVGKTAWAAGKKIRYTLSLANNGVTMQVNPTLGGWGNEVPGE